MISAVSFVSFVSFLPGYEAGGVDMPIYPFIFIFMQLRSRTFYGS